MAKGRGRSSEGRGRGGRGREGSRGGRNMPSAPGRGPRQEDGSSTRGRGGRAPGPAPRLYPLLGSSPPAGGYSFAHAAGTTAGAGTAGRGGRGRGTSPAPARGNAPHSTQPPQRPLGGRGGRGGFGAVSPFDVAYGMANQFLFVEQERDGVWKVSVPSGQRFGKPFLAGLEVWAQQLASGQLPQLQRNAAAHHHAAAATPPPPPLPSPPPSAGAFAPRTTPPAASASMTSGSHPIKALTDGGLPSLNPRAPSLGGAAAPALSPAPPPPPPLPPAALPAGSMGADALAPGSLDFLTMLQAAAGIPEPSGGSVGGASATAQVQAQAPTAAATPTDGRYVPAAVLREPAAGSEGEVYPGLVAPLLEAAGQGSDTAVQALYYDHEDQAEDEEIAEGEEGYEGADVRGEGEQEEDTEEDFGGAEEEEGEEEDLDEEEEGVDEGHDDYEEEEENEDDYGEEEVSGEVEEGGEEEELEFATSDDEGPEPVLDRGPRVPAAPAPAPTPPPPARPAGSSAGAGAPHNAGVARAPLVLAAAGHSQGQAALPGGLDTRGRVRVSLRLERQGLTDGEARLLVDWYTERGSPLIELAKLWLFDNDIGDEGAAAVARLLHPSLLELHLSHNRVGDKGAAALAAMLPASRPMGLRPLWLRLEWNMISVDRLRAALEEQRAARGLVTDIPRVEAAPAKDTPGGGKGGVAVKGGGHELQLVLDRKAAAGASVQLPWVACQKQAPQEAEVLRTVRGFYSQKPAEAEGSSPAAAQQRPAAPPAPLPPPPAPAATASPAPMSMRPPPPPPPARRASHEAQPFAAGVAATHPAGDDAAAADDDNSKRWRSGPLLLFPDTSALLAMLGANAATGRPPLEFRSLLQLASEGRFGRSLPLHQQAFVVVTDSVMKQLDGLKALPDTRAAVRYFMAEGLEQAGPAGYDFLTVLGGHEGEGLALAGGALGLAGSRSPLLASKGQAVDLKIVEVALFFQKEVATRGPQQHDEPAAVPVMLLSNDNAQIAAAKSHGLPAFRLSGAVDVAAQLAAATSGGAPLTSGLLRSTLAPHATAGLGSAATTSIQEHFDHAVAALRGAASALQTATNTLQQVEALAAAPAGGQQPAEEALCSIRQLLCQPPGTSGPMAAMHDGAASAAADLARLKLSDAGVDPGGGGGRTGPGEGLVSELWGMVSGLGAQLAEWERVVRSHQEPSRVLSWASRSERLGSGSAAPASSGVLALAPP